VSRPSEAFPTNRQSVAKSRAGKSIAPSHSLLQQPHHHQRFSDDSKEGLPEVTGRSSNGTKGNGSGNGNGRRVSRTS